MYKLNSIFPLIRNSKCLKAEFFILKLKENFAWIYFRRKKNKTDFADFHKTEIRKNQLILKLTFKTDVLNALKTDARVFCACPNLFDFFTLLHKKMEVFYLGFLQ